jgi:hypothetical protein
MLRAKGHEVRGVVGAADKQCRDALTDEHRLELHRMNGVHRKQLAALGGQMRQADCDPRPLARARSKSPPYSWRRRGVPAALTVGGGAAYETLIRASPVREASPMKEAYATKESNATKTSARNASPMDKTSARPTHTRRPQEEHLLLELYRTGDADTAHALGAFLDDHSREEGGQRQRVAYVRRHLEVQRLHLQEQQRKERDGLEALLKYALPAHLSLLHIPHPAIPCSNLRSQQ